MKIVITDYFKKIFLKTCKNIVLEDVIRKINLDSKNFIDLNYPFYKLKIKVGNKSYRLILFVEKESVNILAINIFDKKDKTFGENISWTLCKKEILKYYHRNLDDIENNKYTIFDGSKK